MRKIFTNFATYCTYIGKYYPPRIVPSFRNSMKMVTDIFQLSTSYSGLTEEEREWERVEKERELKRAELERARQELETRRRIEERWRAKQEAEAKTKGTKT